MLLLEELLTIFDRHVDDATADEVVEFCVRFDLPLDDEDGVCCTSGDSSSLLINKTRRILINVTKYKELNIYLSEIVITAGDGVSVIVIVCCVVFKLL